MSQHDCYHCGLPVPPEVSLSVVLDDVDRPMCCIGCHAVAEAIIENGLSAYYRHRDARPEGARDNVPDILETLKRYDHPEFQKHFVATHSGESAEAHVLIEGIVCAACIWLLERHLAKCAGVLEFKVDFATHRARVIWNPSTLNFSEVLIAVARIGYRAYPYDPHQREALATKERRSLLLRLFVAGFGAMQVMMYALPAYLTDDFGIEPWINVLMRWASLFLTLPVVGYSAMPFFLGAIRDYRQGRLGMDTPIALAIIVAFIGSTWVCFAGEGRIYFDSVSMFVFLLLLARYLEMRARQKSAEATEALAKLTPSFATRVMGYPEKRVLEEMIAHDLQEDDIVLVRAGETIPADGEIIEGQSHANESLLTGEYAPVAKKEGDSVIAGSLNVEHPLFIRVKAVGEATRLAGILRLITRASFEKPRRVLLADQFAGHFTAGLLLFSVITAGVWLMVDASRVLEIMISVWVVACPCALSLATPMTVAIAHGVMARQGALCTRSHVLETLAKITHVIFDKTGTLTRGEIALTGVHCVAPYTEEAVLSLAMSMEYASGHPIAEALRRAAAARGIVCQESFSTIEHHLGHGMMASQGGHVLRLGRVDFVAALHGLAVPTEYQTLLEGEHTLIALGDATGWRAFFTLSDTLRDDAPALLSALQGLGLQTLLLSGDTEGAVQRVARALKITEAYAAKTPEDKYAFVHDLQNKGAVVAMVGDGVNDAPVLAEAALSVAMGSGSAIARGEADIVLLSEKLLVFLSAYRISLFGERIVRQNLVWALGYNFIAIPFAMLGWVTPWMAAIGMSLSSILVVGNALRLEYYGKACD